MDVMFSIIVPIYNVQDYLKKCIDSILKQSYTGFQLILVDDGSKDKSSVICDQYKELDKRIIVIHKKNGGLVSARNIGVRYAKGKYIGYVDGDDWIEPNLLKCVKTAIDETNAEIISYDYYNNFNGNEVEFHGGALSGFYNKSELQSKIYNQMFYDKKNVFYSFGVIPTVWSKFFKADLLRRNLCSNEKISFGEDVACTYKSLLEANSMMVLNECLYHYRRNNVSMTKSYDSKRFEKTDVLVSYLDSCFNNNELIKVQLSYYYVFLTIHLLVNESRSSRKVNQSINEFRTFLISHSLDKIIDFIEIEHLRGSMLLIVKLLKTRKYKLLLIILKIGMRFKK